jgi:alpha-beta hydrolase superfamily lysophospholipase
VGTVLVCGLTVTACSGTPGRSGPATPAPSPAAARSTTPAAGATPTATQPAVAQPSWAARASAAPTSARPTTSLYDASAGSGPAGEVLAVQPVTAPQGVRAWVVVYRSTADDGRPTAVSGLVAEPDGGRPTGVVAFAHGTTGLPDSCAPSRDGTSSKQWTQVRLFDLARAGYAVAATDFPGLGTAGPHAYLVGTSSGRSVLDSVRAARRLTGAPANTVLYGYSQGGQAALWASRLAARYAPDLHIAGTVALAPMSDVSDLVAAATARNGAAGSYLVPVLVAASWSRVFGLRTYGILTPAGRELADRTTRRCVPDLGSFPGRAGTVRLGSAPSAAFARQLRAQDVSRGGSLGKEPIEIFQARNDDVVPFWLTRNAVTRMCRAGADVALHPLSGAHHSVVIAPAVLSDVRRWIADRFRGAPAPGGCQG